MILNGEREQHQDLRKMIDAQVEEEVGHRRLAVGLRDPPSWGYGHNVQGRVAHEPREVDTKVHFHAGRIDTRLGDEEGYHRIVVAFDAGQQVMASTGLGGHVVTPTEAYDIPRSAEEIGSGHIQCAREA